MTIFFNLSWTNIKIIYKSLFNVELNNSVYQTSENYDYTWT